MAEKIEEKKLWRFKNGRPPQGREEHAGKTFEIRNTELGWLATYPHNGGNKIFGIRLEDVEPVKK